MLPNLEFHLKVGWRSCQGSSSDTRISLMIRIPGLPPNTTVPALQPQESIQGRKCCPPVQYSCDMNSEIFYCNDYFV